MEKEYPRWANKFHLVWNGFDPEEPLAALPIPPRSYRMLVHAGVVYRQRHPFWLAESLTASSAAAPSIRKPSASG